MHVSTRPLKTVHCVAGGIYKSVCGQVPILALLDNHSSSNSSTNSLSLKGYIFSFYGRALRPGYLVLTTGHSQSLTRYTDHISSKSPMVAMNLGFFCRSMCWWVRAKSYFPKSCIYSDGGGVGVDGCNPTEVWGLALIEVRVISTKGAVVRG